MRPLLFGAACLALALTLAAPARAGVEEDCQQSDDPVRTLRGCTAVIEGGSYAGAGLFWAYFNRGLAHYNLGDPVQSVRDYDKAAELNPADPDTFFNRALAYSDLGNHQQAVADYTESLRINPDDA
jgi:tetratricopeptide (TPR) repeat protein